MAEHENAAHLRSIAIQSLRAVRWPIIQCRDCIKQLKHLGVVCKRLHIPSSCCPLPVRSFCFHTEAVENGDPILLSLAACDGAVIKHPWIEPEADFSRRRLPAFQVMQAYRHDFHLPTKDWTPVSEELNTVMKSRLSHVWGLNRVRLEDIVTDLMPVRMEWSDKIMLVLMSAVYCVAQNFQHLTVYELLCENSPLMCRNSVYLPRALVQLASAGRDKVWYVQILPDLIRELAVCR